MRMSRGWTTLRDLPPGMIFVTLDGVLAVKSEYAFEDGQARCILLDSGEYAYFEFGNRTRVRPVQLKTMWAWPRVSFAFLWYDFWIGFYWNAEKRTLYWCPLPCCVVKIEM